VVATTLPGAGKYYAAIQQRQEASRSTTRVQRLIERANAVSIFDVLNDFFGMDVPAEGSMKMRCPFAEGHADGGLERSWRAYSLTNSSFCFSDCGFLTPVRLVQLQKGWKAPRAAEFILLSYGLLRPRHYRERYNELLVEHERGETVAIHPQYVVQALHTALSASPSYRLRQFDTDVMAAMEKALEGLDLVVAHHPDRIEEWFGRVKTKMLQIVEEGH
jgi:hypothetical protein